MSLPEVKVGKVMKRKEKSEIPSLENRNKRTRKAIPVERVSPPHNVLYIELD